MWQAPAAALGQRIRENPAAPWRDNVGVAADVFDDGVNVQPPATAYWPPLMEHFEGVRVHIRRSMTIAIRSSRAGTEALLKDVQKSVWAVNGHLLLARVQTLDALYERAVARTFFTLLMLVIAASMALLGLGGIFGVIAYAATFRCGFSRSQRRGCAALGRARTTRSFRCRSLPTFELSAPSNETSPLPAGSSAS